MFVISALFFGINESVSLHTNQYSNFYVLSLSMNFKRKRPKERRAGCLLCKPWKFMGNSLEAKKRQDRIWARYPVNLLSINLSSVSHS